MGFAGIVVGRTLEALLPGWFAAAPYAGTSVLVCARDLEQKQHVGFDDVPSDRNDLAPFLTGVSYMLTMA